MSSQTPQPDETRSAVDGAGPQYWRSVEHLAESPELLESLQREFPGYDAEQLRAMPRRHFLKLMAASMALAGITQTGCRRWPERQVHPYARRPEGTQPGVAEYYATITKRDGAAVGIVAKSYDGRPIKIEGNQLHPFSQGAADAWSQASILSLYDPDRSRHPLQREVQGGLGAQLGNSELRHVTNRDLKGDAPSAGTPPARRSWSDFERFAEQHFTQLRPEQGRGLAVLAPPPAGPTLKRLKDDFLAEFPQATWHAWEPLHRDHVWQGSMDAFGQTLRPQYHLDRADVIVCFDADLLGQHPAQQRHARDWADARRQVDRGQMNRLWMVEASYGLTGSVADHRLPVRPDRIVAVLHGLAVRLGVVQQGEAPSLTEHEATFIAHMATDLSHHRGASLVAVGSAQPPAAHGLAHAINHALDNTGVTVDFTEEPLAEVGLCQASYESLWRSLEAGDVRTLVILGGNPTYDGPANQPLQLDQRPGLTSIHLGPYVDETAVQSTWHLPMAHELECWDDGWAWDGTWSVQQPLILPLFEGRSAVELLALLAGESEPVGRAQVRRTFEQHVGGADFERRWRRTLHDGLLVDSAWPAVDTGPPRLDPAGLPFAPDQETVQLQFVSDRKVCDGRFANNGWLQELPDPMTKLTWDNAALVSKADADAWGVTTGDMVALSVNAGQDGQRRLEIPIYVMPGLAPATVVLPLGYGRTRAGRVGNGVGFDTYRLRTAAGCWNAPVTVQPLRRRHRLAMTQDHHLIDAVGMWGRERRVGEKGASGYLIRDGLLADYLQDRDLFRPSNNRFTLPLYEAPIEFNDPHAWGMAVDLNACIGCSGCVVACQAENNIPIVGKREVGNHRAMHWLRIDRYFKGPVEDPDTVHMPLACTHCETAPCEEVCPVAATVHDSEGLNVMVYNRCIGTRYCANNCPFKVRRFNYFDYHAQDPHGPTRPWLGIPDTEQREAVGELQALMFNPDVTVRMRGVMEKCTYCTQRIQEARRQAKLAWSRGERDGPQIQDGEVVPACAAACPTEAIVFGDLNDPDSRVSQLRRSPRNYAMLEELNLRPRTQYLAKVRNPDTEGREPV